MAISEALIGKIALATLNHALSQRDLHSAVRRKLGRDPTRLAFNRALQRAVTKLEQKHPEWAASFFDENFFKKEGTPILAKLLTPSTSPDPTELATRWASLLSRRSDNKTVLARQIELAAADFIADLTEEMRSETEFKDLHDSRNLAHIASNVEAIRSKLGADLATPGTRWDYLRWLSGRNLYLDSRGTLQTQRQVQLKLDEIYVSLSAQRENAPVTEDRPLRQKELEELESKLAVSSLSPEEVEEQREQLLLALGAQYASGEATPRGPTIELAELVKRHHHAVILGDPGSGKTTLVRYLALEHAQALLRGKDEANAGLGAARFPILIRIAAYAESGNWRRMSLSDFLLEYHRIHDCPSDGLADLLREELVSGGCLILLDGLDEITSADERRGVVGRIEDFIRRYRNVDNHFVVTSRIAGYRTAPLEWPFVHYTIHEMDDAQIERFLDRWCHAVEAAETPELSLEEQDAVARREMDGILSAIKNSPGVGRLATNPLLLRILALIHRTGAQLPQKRIELYKLAADTLARTWRVAQGVPESALVKDEYLTRVLSNLAYWLHNHKASGIATEREVQDSIGREWARINAVDWDSDDPSPAIMTEIDNFLLAVRVQTGLFVERAPKRYGFMHLTFEEYYSARYLVAWPKMRLQLIRRHLHDPRWDEPILLALGFVGLDYPDDAGELVATGVLANRGESGAEAIEPTPHEILLGRDFLFGLRCLADQIPMDPRLTRSMLQRLVEELVLEKGSGRFREYRSVLGRSARALHGSQAWSVLFQCATGIVRDENAGVRALAAKHLSRLQQRGRLDTDLENLIASLQHDETPAVREAVAEGLGDMAPGGSIALRTLIELSQDREPSVRRESAKAFAALQRTTTDIVAALVTLSRDNEPSVRVEAADSLGMMRRLKRNAIPALIDLSHDNDPRVRKSAADSLSMMYRGGAEVAGALINLTVDSDVAVRQMAAQGLGAFGDQPGVRDKLVELARDSDPTVRRASAWSLPGIFSVVFPAMDLDAIRAVINLTRDSDSPTREMALFALEWEQSTKVEAVEAWAALSKDDDPFVRKSTAHALGSMRRSKTRALAVLVELSRDHESSVREEAARSMANYGAASREVPAILIDISRDTDAAVRSAAIESLGFIRPVRAKAVSRVIELVQDDEASVREMAAAALGRMRPMSTKVVEPLLCLSEDPNTAVRRTAVIALGQMQAPPRRVIDRLIELTSDGERVVRWSAAGSLMGLDDTGPDITEAVRTAIPAGDVAQIVSELDLEQSFKIGSLCMKRMELEPLGQPLLAAILNDEDAKRQNRYPRIEAADLLGGVAELEDATVEALFLGLIDKLSNVQESSARALAQLGRRFPSKGIEMRLLQALDDPLYSRREHPYSRSGQDFAFEGLSMLMAKQTPAGL